MPKSVYNLLSKTTSSPLEYASSAGVDNLSDIIVHNDHAASGRVYLEINGLYISSASTPDESNFTPQFYSSFNGYTWFKYDTGDPAGNGPETVTLSTGGSYMYNINNVGWYFRFGFYNTATVSAVRAHIVLDDRGGF